MEIDLKELTGIYCKDDRAGGLVLGGKVVEMYPIEGAGQATVHIKTNDAKTFILRWGPEIVGDEEPEPDEDSEE